VRKNHEICTVGIPDSSKVSTTHLKKTGIVGAMYYDSDWETTKDWIINNLGIRVMKKAGAIESSK
jgi:hypothetical protein